MVKNTTSYLFNAEPRVSIDTLDMIPDYVPN